MSRLEILPCLDSELMAATRQQELDVPRPIAARLGRSAVDAADSGHYLTDDGHSVDWRDAVATACARKRSISQYDVLPDNQQDRFERTVIQVTNETTLGAAQRLAEK